VGMFGVYSRDARHLDYDSIGNVPEAAILRRLPSRALDLGRERFIWGMRLALQGAHLGTQPFQPLGPPYMTKACTP
jgi:hypothetical protein